MAPSGRQRNSGVASRLSHAPTSLPPYQTLSHPLNQEARQALHDLPKTHRLDGLMSHLSNVNENLTQVAGDVNYRYLRKSVAHQKRKARRQGNDEGDENDDQALEEMRSNVERMTTRLEEGVRKTIDAKAAVESVQSALKELHTNIVSSQSAVRPSQNALGTGQPSQKRHRRAAELSDDDDNSNNEEDSSQVQPLGLLKRKITEFSSEYEDLSMRNRYSSNNDYIGFKRIIHESSHPEGHAPPIAHPSTWFPGSPSGEDGQHNEGDIDDDIEVASERISIKCPLTLLEMEDPVSSNKCTHSFERTAILEMIQASQLRIKGTSGKLEQHMKCPVCEVHLSASDLRRDAVLLRKIRRIQAAQAAPDSDSDSTPADMRGTQIRAPAEIDSDNDDEDDGAAPRARSSRPKIEGEIVAARVKQRDVSMIPATQLESTSVVPETQVVDLEDNDDHDEEEEEEEEDEDDE